MGDGKKRDGGAWAGGWHTPAHPDRQDSIRISCALYGVDSTRVAPADDDVRPFDHRESRWYSSCYYRWPASGGRHRFDSAISVTARHSFTSARRLYDAGASAGKAGMQAICGRQKIRSLRCAAATPAEYTKWRSPAYTALGQDAISGARPVVRRMRSLEAGSDAEKFAAVAARQGRNV